jgi:hypothetical protein
MLNKDWWVKNAGGLLLSSFVAVAVYAASAYITSAVTKEMKGYLPLTVWNQWAQERGEWRGQVDQRIKSMEGEMVKLREDNMRELQALTTAVAVQTAILNDVKAKIDKHMDSK